MRKKKHGEDGWQMLQGLGQSREYTKKCRAGCLLDLGCGCRRLQVKKKKKHGFLVGGSSRREQLDDHRSQGFAVVAVLWPSGFDCCPLAMFQAEAESCGYIVHPAEYC